MIRTLAAATTALAFAGTAFAGTAFTATLETPMEKAEKIVLRKGRENYLCLLNFEEAAGRANAGVALTSVNSATWAVLGGLIIGKPLGVWLFGTAAADGLKLGLPDGMKNSDLVVLGMVAAIGFTVSLFIAAVAFDPGPIQDAAKMGALFSFFAAALSIAAGVVFRVEKQN